MSQTEYRQTKFTAPPGATELLLVRHGESRAAKADEPFPLVKVIRNLRQRVGLRRLRLGNA